MSFWGLVQLGVSTAIFLLAATAAKQWGLAPSLGKLVWTLALYTLGNLVMLRLIREFGMSISLSLSAVIQLVAVTSSRSPSTAKNSTPCRPRAWRWPSSRWR